MYFPSEQFLPFLRDVDRNVRQYMNPDCFQRHGSQLVEVCTVVCMYACACTHIVIVCTHIIQAVVVMCIILFSL